MAEPSSPADPSPPPPRSSSRWGRYPNHNARLVPLHWQSDFPRRRPRPAQGALPVGMGRSYGDVCLLKDGNLLVTTGMNRLLAFDPATGVLTAEAGITLAQILDFAVPRGFFLPVSPGTKYVTLGGAIANDIHGKNHHVAGTFGSHVTRLRARPLRRLPPPLLRHRKPRLVRRHHRRPRPHRPHHLGAAQAPPHRLPQDRLRGHPVPRHRRVPRPHQAVRPRRVHRLLGRLHLHRQELRPRHLHAGRPLRGPRSAHSLARAQARLPLRGPRLRPQPRSPSRSSTPPSSTSRSTNASSRSRTTSPSSTRSTRSSTGTASTARAASCSSSTSSPGTTPAKAPSPSSTRSPSPDSPASSPSSKPSATSPPPAS